MATKNNRSQVGRLGRKRFNTDGVQGKGSFILFKKPTYLESQTMLRELQPLTAGLRELDALIDADKIRVISDQMGEIIVDAANDKFEDWNWKDNDGEDLPVLSELDFEEDLLQEEVEVVLDCIRELYGIVSSDDESLGKSVA